MCATAASFAARTIPSRDLPTGASLVTSDPSINYWKPGDQPLDRSPSRWLLLARSGWMLTGLFILAYGIDLQRVAHLGLMPWAVLHQGVAYQTSLSFGQANILVGCLLVVIGLVLGVKPVIGTVVVMVVTGVFLDLILAWNLIPPPDIWGSHLSNPSVPRYIYMVLGVVIMGFGTAWYASANLGTGPRDGLMLGLVRKTGWTVGVVRSCLEGMVLLTGWLLGGPVGLGTVCGVAGLGWVIHYSFKFFRWVQQVTGLGYVLRVPIPERPVTKEA